ncbi:uncharacterized protein RCC_10710 [Ramularia collo-cygni]|uniref:Uncharacterized protein n=1 Tax=Ramularia collo-cygni TaxID=112498 RepID=A0A2D3VKE6_9PEZI|nr:uncharacterized protein RCC_10710 [Ramularia collo-cygni]CZT24981.1 uncharacterized protein RCC_10710 [Ramularia collo-cygni]
MWLTPHLLLLLPLCAWIIPLVTSQQTTTETSPTFQTDMSTDPIRDALSASFMNITFSPSTSPICSASPNSSSSSNTALSIAIRTLPQTQACFDLDKTFSDPETTYTSQGTGRCDSQLGLCGIKYTVFNSLSREEEDVRNGEWGNVFYTQVRNPLDVDGEMDGEGSGGRLELEVFDKEGCESKGDLGSARWNCVEGRGTCGEVGFGVRSFRVKLMEAKDVGMGSCVIAQMGGGGRVGGSLIMGGFVVGLGVVVVGLGIL